MAEEPDWVGSRRSLTAAAERAFQPVSRIGFVLALPWLKRGGQVGKLGERSAGRAGALLARSTDSEPAFIPDHAQPMGSHHEEVHLSVPQSPDPLSGGGRKASAVL